jgi:hypothetical protein
MSSIGQTWTLEVLRFASPGAFLDARDLGEVLLPNKYCPENIAVGDNVPVFLYHDSEGRVIASTQVPLAKVGEFAYLEASSESDFGVFLDWGLDKDLLVPFGEQHRPMIVGKRYLVRVYINEADGRIVASSKIDKFLDGERPHTFTKGQPVELIIANTTALGFKAIVDQSHWGVLYKNEVDERLSFGQYKKGFVKFVRPDGKIDLSLDVGQEGRDRYAMTILNYLRQNDGFAPTHDKSDVALIKRLFGMSKKVFKKTIGGLYKKRLITIKADGIHLTESK